MDRSGGPVDEDFDTSGLKCRDYQLLGMAFLVIVIAEAGVDAVFGFDLAQVFIRQHSDSLRP